jgi:peptidoglycan/xylan/chitin deacetylase (PgdA/CDA1 family)
VVLARLTRGLAAGDILLMHDGNSAPTATGQPVILTALPRLLDVFKAVGLRSVTLDHALQAP